ncbi:carboxymuconolactone decarboxylase family protein [Actinopolymorpha pittospori]|uniref:Alkylhydroperoxidase/carboxymuconolactone decarboxylase family protein YurZ n=1 Tax=Actinopolymorpha pittospori TaxID=648752 RepID=A0A927MW97_9ACTN|nr:carboxymuconolactone decarboxylase family protein [Actinopolymorpha pittospori]MBE1604467.1 alkylhydroperoxidase/carboxymuconolactone decarboxylase family protein YurZ [Actinopolymorpha pittospori]
MSDTKTNSDTTTSTLDLTELDPVFAQMGAATVRHAGAVPELTDREKVFLQVVADVCQPALGLPFEMHVRRGLNSGVSTADIRALLRLVSYDTGYHAALAAFERLAEIEAAAGLPRPDTEPLAADLLETGPGPEAARALLVELDDHFAEHFLLQSRMRSGYGPGTLSVRERAFATMSVDVHYQTLEESFQIHIGRALGAGASRDDVRAVLRFNAQFGMTRAWRAWKALNAHLAQLDTAD